jgi:hypothetical protein
MSNAVNALSATVHIGLSKVIEGYLLPDGSFRYGLPYVSQLIGREKTYLSHMIKKGSKKLKALRQKGFSCDLIRVSVSRPTTGGTRPNTIGFNDFCIIVEHEAVEENNPDATALLTAAFREVLRSRTQEAFGLTQDTLETKVVNFQQAFEERLDWLSEDRKDFNDLWLPGDEMYFPDFVDWQDECESKYFEQKAEYLLSQ